MINGSLSGGALRCGTDLVDVDRIYRAIERLGKPFLIRVFTPAELADCLNDGQLTLAAAASLAARFAAKEAVAKALGTGIWRNGVNWTDITIRRSESGAPVAELSGGARKVYDKLGGQSLAISLSHERKLALAFCVLTCRLADQKNDHAQP